MWSKLYLLTELFFQFLHRPTSRRTLSKPYNTNVFCIRPKIHIISKYLTTPYSRRSHDRTESVHPSCQDPVFQFFGRVSMFNVCSDMHGAGCDTTLPFVMSSIISRLSASFREIWLSVACTVQLLTLSPKRKRTSMHFMNDHVRAKSQVSVQQNLSWVPTAMRMELLGQIYRTLFNPVQPLSLSL